MRELIERDIVMVAGGMSQTTKACLEGGSIGMLGGAVIGGLIASPAYFTLMNQDGISSSHHLVGWFLISAGIVVGGMLGSFIGTGGGWLVSCHYESDNEPR